MFGSGPTEELPGEATSAIVRPYRPSSRKTRSRNPLGSSCCLAPERWGRASSARRRNSQPLASSLQVPTWLKSKTLWSGSYYSYRVVPQPAHTASNFAGGRVTLVLLRLFFWPLSSSHFEAKNENGREKLPAVCWGSAVTALSRDVWIWPSQSPDKATLVRPYSTSSRKTRSRSLLACRCSFRSRCQWLAHRSTGHPG